MKENQNKLQKNKKYWGIVRTTRIFTDYRRNLRRLQTIRYKDISKTSTSNNQWEHTGSDAKKYGTGPKMVWQWPNEIWRLVEKNVIVPQEQ